MSAMKSQDILLLFKLASLEARERSAGDAAADTALAIPNDWRGWEDAEAGMVSGPAEEAWSVRGLEESTGISKSQVSGALRRCVAVGLAHPDRRNGRLRCNTRALHGLVVNGLRDVFPAVRGALVRGIPTAHAAPVLAGKLLSAGEHVDVWEDGLGEILGQRVEPLHPAAPYAVRRDPGLYAMLALADAIRLGRERESALAGQLLDKYLQGYW